VENQNVKAKKIKKIMFYDGPMLMFFLNAVSVESTLNHKQDVLNLKIQKG
jgi:hypothetical protein